MDGIKFHSKVESQRYKELKAREEVGRIQNLLLQVKYPIYWPHEEKATITTYVTDFTYVENGVEIVEDVKGKVTDVFRLKAKLMKAAFGIEVRIVFKKSRNGTQKWFIGNVQESAPTLARIE